MKGLDGRMVGTTEVQALVDAMRCIERGKYDGLGGTRLNVVECRVFAGLALRAFTEKRD